MNGITSGKEQNRQLTELYVEAFPLFAKYISKQGGTLEETKDIFQEALIVCYEKQSQQNFLFDKSAKSYLLGVCKNKWLKVQRDQPPTQSLNEIDLADDSETGLSTGKLLQLLKSSGEKCLNMLQSFYYQNLSMKDISTKFGFSSERSATVQKYKCLEKVRENIKQKSLHYADFID
ncbi:MAG: sigma-70 family RNA polymerase sigma factor [Bacteroidota bacterium]